MVTIEKTAQPDFVWQVFELKPPKHWQPPVIIFKLSSVSAFVVHSKVRSPAVKYVCSRYSLLQALVLAQFRVSWNQNKKKNTGWKPVLDFGKPTNSKRLPGFPKFAVNRFPPVRCPSPLESLPLCVMYENMIKKSIKIPDPPSYLY